MDTRDLIQAVTLLACFFLWYRLGVLTERGKHLQGMLDIVEHLTMRAVTHFFKAVQATEGLDAQKRVVKWMLENELQSSKEKS